MTWYKNLVTGERCRVDEYGNLFAPLLPPVSDGNIDAVKLRMKVNAGSGMGAIWSGDKASGCCSSTCEQLRDGIEVNATLVIRRCKSSIT